MRKDERGIALLTVTMVSFLLLLLGLSLTFTSMTDFTISNELVNKKKAIQNAYAGYSAYKALKGQNLDTLLASSTQVPKYINYSEPGAGTDAETYFNRNPLAPMEAMNVDFDNPPTPISTRTVTGLLTPAAGETLASGGRYWVKVTDNDDGDSDLSTDQDGIVYMRVLGIQKNPPGQVSTYGGTVKNSVTIIEAKLKRDQTFNATAPFTFAHPQTVVGLESGGSFYFDGYNHDAMTLADLLVDNHSHITGGSNVAGLNYYFDAFPNDASVPMNSFFSQLNPPQKLRFTGDVSDYMADPDCSCDVSIHDATNDIRNDPDPEATKVFDPNYMVKFFDRVKQHADLTATAGTDLSGINLGTDASPQITYCEGDCKVGGNASGAGLLVVRGNLIMNELTDNLDDNFYFNGLIMSLGESFRIEYKFHLWILGGLLWGYAQDQGGGNYAWATPTIRLRDDANFYYSPDSLQFAIDLLPMKTLAWREITSELEPSF